jgi:hypothetical protein
MKKLISILIAIIFVFFSVNANAQLKQFKTSEFHFGCPSPAEELYFTWDEKTGKVSEFYWNHGGEIWFLYEGSASKVVRDERTLYDYDVYLKITTKGYETTAYQIRAKMTLTAMRTDGAVFGGVYEGTGVYPMMANGVYVSK